MQLDQVVPILQTGLAGLAFLLAFMSYRIITTEQSKDSPRVVILRSARNYFVLCILLAVIVGGFQIGRIWLIDVDKVEISECRDSFDLLILREERGESAMDLRHAINSHIMNCAAVIRQLDEVE